MVPIIYKRLDASKSEIRLIEMLSDGDDGGLVKYEHLVLYPFACLTRRSISIH